MSTASVESLTSRVFSTLVYFSRLLLFLCVYFSSSEPYVAQYFMMCLNPDLRYANNLRYTKWLNYTWQNGDATFFVQQ